MRASRFDFYDIGDAAVELGVPRSNLRYFIDLGKVPACRTSGGSRLLSRKDMSAARKWFAAHAAKKARARAEAKKAREKAAVVVAI